MTKKKQQLDFAVLIEVDEPDYEAERLFVRAEKALVARRLEQIKAMSAWGKLALWIDRAPSVKGWRKYDHALDRYAEKLVEHEGEVDEGLVPVMIPVMNDSNVTKRGINVRVSVSEGAIHPAKKAPERPIPVDRAGRKLVSWPFTGFWRSGVKITRSRIEAKFNRLAAQDGAMLTHRPVYIQMSRKTRLTYEIESRGSVDLQKGEVPV